MAELHEKIQRTKTFVIEGIVSRQGLVYGHLQTRTSPEKLPNRGKGTSALWILEGTGE